MGHLVVLEGKSRSLLASDYREEACSVDGTKHREAPRDEDGVIGEFESLD